MRVNILFLMLFCSILFGQNKSTVDKPLAQNIIIKYYESVSKFDFTQMRQLCSDDFNLVESSGIYSLEEYIGFLEPDVGQLKINYTIEDIKSKKEGKTSWVTYIKNTKIITEKKEVFLKSRETAVLTIINEEWNIRLIHSANIKD